MAKGEKNSTNIYKNIKKMSPITTKNALPKQKKLTPKKGK
jgi:hypothetical protein